MSPDGVDELAIRQVITAQADAWNRGDAAAWGAACRADVSFTNILGMRWSTRDGFVARHAEMFRGVFAGSRLSIEIERLQRCTRDVACAEVLTELAGFRGLPPGIRADADGRLRTRLLEVFVKEDGTWKIAACHNTAIQPGLMDR